MPLKEDKLNGYSAMDIDVFGDSGFAWQEDIRLKKGKRSPCTSWGAVHLPFHMLSDRQSVGTWDVLAFQLQHVGRYHVQSAGDP